MITEKMIEKARKERERSLVIGGIVISFLGLFIMVYALIEMFTSEANFDGVAFHVLFMFGAIVAAFGIFSFPESK